MKLTKQILGIMALGAMTLTQTACQSDSDFLEEHSYKKDDSGMFNSESEIEGSINMCYKEIQYLVQGTNAGHSYMLFGLGLDTFGPKSSTGGDNAGQFSDWTYLNSASGWARHWYNELFYLVHYANTAIDNIEEKSITYTSDTKKEELLGEARFFRGWAYRTLAGMYGNVPILEHHATTVNTGYTPNTRKEVWQFCYEDFKYAAEHMSKTERLQGCVTRAAADHMLAEICISLGKFDEAIAAATRAIDGTDGDYQLMTTRFGSSASEATDHYGHDLSAAKGGAYWDLFRTPANLSGNTNQDYGVLGNKEALWTSQFSYGNYTVGGGGMSWWRVRGYSKMAAFFFCDWIKGNGTNRTLSDGTTVYLFGDDAACFPEGVKGSSTGYGVSTTAANKRWRADNVNRDSVATYTNIGSQFYTCRYLFDPNAKDYLWAKSKSGDREDIRGSEIMIQRDWYTPGGVKISKLMNEARERSELAKQGRLDEKYILTGSDTIGYGPRYWKFSTEKYPNDNPAQYEYEPYMIRLAETYLLRAEAYLAKGDKQKAADDINVLHDRANAPRCTASEVDIDYILDERTRELFGEEHRQITLNRLSCNTDDNGTVYSYIAEKYPTQNATESNTLYARVHKYGISYVNETKESNESKGRKWNATENRFESNIKPYQYQYPIPDDVIKSNTGAEYPQNYGY